MNKVDSRRTTLTCHVAFLPQELLPANCCHIVGFSSKYQESFRCNFLGLSVGVNLPGHIVDSEFHVLLDILPPLKVNARAESDVFLLPILLLPILLLLLLPILLLPILLLPLLPILLLPILLHPIHLLLLLLPILLLPILLLPILLLPILLFILLLILLFLLLSLNYSFSLSPPSLPTQRYYSLSADTTDYSHLEEEQNTLEQYKLMVYSAQPRQLEQKCEWTLLPLASTSSSSSSSLTLLFSSTPCSLSSSSDPLIVQRLASIVNNDVFSDALVSRAIQNLKEEWMK